MDKIVYTYDINPFPIQWSSGAGFIPLQSATDHAFIDIAPGSNNEKILDRLYLKNTDVDFTAGKLAIYKYTSEADFFKIQIVDYTEFNNDPNKRVLITDYNESEFLVFKTVILQDFVNVCCLEPDQLNVCLEPDQLNVDLQPDQLCM